MIIKIQNCINTYEEYNNLLTENIVFIDLFNAFTNTTIIVS